MEGHKQLPANEVHEGRTAAPLHIHVIKAMGWIRPITLANLTNHTYIMYMYLFANIFQPVLVPPLESTSDFDVQEYFASLQLSSIVTRTITRSLA